MATSTQARKQIENEYENMDRQKIKDVIIKEDRELTSKIKEKLKSDGIELDDFDLEDIDYYITNIQPLTSPESFAGATVDYAQDVGVDAYIEDEFYSDAVSTIDYEVGVDYTQCQIVTPKMLALAFEEDIENDPKAYIDHFVEEDKDEIKEVYIEKATSQGVRLEDAENEFDNGRPNYKITIKGFNADKTADFIYEEKFKDGNRTLKEYFESGESIEDCHNMGEIDFDIEVDEDPMAYKEQYV